jgi:hypothetical protein
MMQSSLWQMVRTKASEYPILDILDGSAGGGRVQAPRGNAPPPPPRPPASLEQLLETQNDLMRRLVENDQHHGADAIILGRQQPRHQERDSSYLDFLATHPPVFSDAINHGSRQVAPHHGVQVRTTSLYRVSKDCIRSTAIPRLSWSLVGYLHCHPTC